jgi:uncharacterized protein (DUF2126 family)
LRDPEIKPGPQQSAGWIVRTALCVEPRDGKLFVFMPPTPTLEDYLDLVARIESTATVLKQPVLIEGYPPPFDYRLQLMRVTPDPGVIEVNIHPARNWDEVVKTTTGVYEEAHLTRLGTEKFMLDGRHTGTGGGNHVVIGGETPSESPLLRRPDLLASLIAYWHQHSSARPARRRAWTRRAMTPFTNSKWHSRNCARPRVDRFGWWTAFCATCSSM